MEKVRVALVGFSSIARVHADAIYHSPRMELKAVVALSDYSEEVRELYDCNFYHDYSI